MGYESKPMTLPRNEGVLARPVHLIDSFLVDTSVVPNVGANIGTATWPSANLIVYCPVRVKVSVVARKLYVCDGAVGTGNLDLGIYSRTGTRLINTGTTAKAASLSIQYVDITDTRLLPGLYYVALQASNATDTYSRLAPAAPILAASGFRSEAAGAFGLPATATWTVDQTLAYGPEVGISLGTVY